MLFDYYKNLLSEKQKKYIEAYFEEDYSLSEIAEANNVSRQAISDNINRTVKLLKNYEKNLGFLKRDEIIKSKLEIILMDKNIDEIREIIKLLEA
ncbi:MAG: hypothetical protein GX287_04640 [Fusobacteria bacterium]|nr:hypothetical protein [Fusobacteriota bacterium]